MNPISSLKERENKEVRNRRIGGIVIIVLLVLSTLGFALSIVKFGGDSSTGETTQGFTRNGIYWMYTAGSQSYYFTYHPTELNLSFTSNKTLIDLAGKKVYIDSNIRGSLQEVSNSLGSYLGGLNEACYGPCERDLPEKDCSSDMLVLRENSIESIREKDGCIFIDGNLKTVDSFLYRMLGIN